MIDAGGDRRRSWRECASLLLLAVALGVAAGLSCAGGQSTVLKSEGPPSALAGARRVAISFNYSRFRVGGMGEAEFIQQQIARDGPAFPERWRDLKVTYERAFIDGFNVEWPGGSVVAFPDSSSVGLVVVPDSLELGRFTEPSVMAVKMGWIVRGVAVEEMPLLEGARSSFVGARFAQLAGRIGRLMGERAGRYLSSRQ